MKRRSSCILFLILFLIGISNADSHAKGIPLPIPVMFGTSENIARLQDVDVLGPNGEALFLGYKTTKRFFGAGLYVTDDGYVLGLRSDAMRYLALTPLQIRELQQRRQLPTPLPSYRLGIFDLLIGYSLWLILAVVAGGVFLAVWIKGQADDDEPAGDLRGATPPAFEEGSMMVQVDGRGAVTFTSSLPPESVKDVRFFGWLANDEVATLPFLPSPAFMGAMVTRTTQGKPPSVLSNLGFLEFLHRGVAELAPQIPYFVEAARAQEAGVLFVVDGRFVDKGISMSADGVPEEEIIGRFSVKDGLISPTDYQANMKYKLWSLRGAARIPQHFRPHLLAKLALLTDRTRVELLPSPSETRGIGEAVVPAVG